MLTLSGIYESKLNLRIKRPKTEPAQKEQQKGPHLILLANNQNFRHHLYAVPQHLR
jgi:hypothetical protein